MIADLLIDSRVAHDQANDATTSERPDYAQRHPLQIAVILRTLVQRHDFVTVEFGDRQIVTQLLYVDSANARFIFDMGSVAANNDALKTSEQLVFRGMPAGVQTEFATHAAVPILFENRPAFETSFPALLYYVQRREYFRVQTPLIDPYLARGTFADEKPFKVELHDLSLGGIALKTNDTHMGELPVGTVLEQVAIQLGAFGTLRLDIEIVAPRHTVAPNGDKRHVIGCKFMTLPGCAERTLQRVVTHLEAKRQVLVSR